VTGLSVGTGIVTYTITAGCVATIAIAVHAAPPITIDDAGLFWCKRTVSHLSDATTGGTWSSGAPTIATVSSTGVVSAVAQWNCPYNVIQSLLMGVQQV
jgi:hypothetical protein